MLGRVTVVLRRPTAGLASCAPEKSEIGRAVELHPCGDEKADEERSCEHAEQ